MNHTKSLPSFTISPVYYSEFHCLASDCPDTCCKGWIIQIDAETCENWKQLSEPLLSAPLLSGVPLSEQPLSEPQLSAPRSSERQFPPCSPSECIETVIRRTENPLYQIRMNEKMECPLLTSDGLCSVVLAHGDQMIPRICQDYPRQITEAKQLLQKSLSVRCAPVLDLLWKQTEFRYLISSKMDIPFSDDPANTGTELSFSDDSAKAGAELPFSDYPARALLNGFLETGNSLTVSASEYLFTIFTACYQMHQKLLLLTPCDAAGYRDYGQELLTPENISEVLCNFSTFLSAAPQTDQKLQQADFALYFDETLRPHHNLMYDVMQSFFDSPVFGPDFTTLFRYSEKLLAAPDETLLQTFLSGQYLPAMAEHRFVLLIMEELFTSVLSAEIADYETILVRLQWLIVQYLVIRYTLFLDTCQDKKADEAQFNYRITRIFRVTDLPDILKIAFFDANFTDWLWTPEYIARLLDL